MVYRNQSKSRGVSRFKIWYLFLSDVVFFGIYRCTHLIYCVLTDIEQKKAWQSLHFCFPQKKDTSRYLYLPLLQKQKSNNEDTDKLFFWFVVQNKKHRFFSIEKKTEKRVSVVSVPFVCFYQQKATANFNIVFWSKKILRKEKVGFIRKTFNFSVFLCVNGTSSFFGGEKQDQR